MKNIAFLESIKHMPFMKLPVRTTVVHLDGATILISPGSMLSDTQLRSVGSVTDIVAPNLYHTGGVHLALTTFPDAKVWGVSGCKMEKPEIEWSGELTEVSWPYQEKLPLTRIMGMPKINEVVFYHSDSKSLIVADLCFNLLDTKGLGARFILGMFGTYKKLSISTFFLKFVSDRAAFRESMKRVLKFDFENIIVGHGRLVEGQANHLLRQLLADRGVLADDSTST